MLDPKRLRADLDATAARLAIKGYTLDVERFMALDASRKDLQAQMESLQNERKNGSKQVGALMKAGDTAGAEAMKAKMAEIGDQLDQAKARFDAEAEELNQWMMEIPNLPDESVPQGKDENDNQELRVVGQKPEFDFEPKDHVELAEAMGGAGYLSDNPVGRIFRDAKLMEIGAGTSEIRRMLVGREMMGAMA